MYHVCEDIGELLEFFVGNFTDLNHLYACIAIARFVAVTAMVSSVIKFGVVICLW